MAMPVRKHLANNWGWYLLGGTVGSLGNYLYCSFATSKRRDALLKVVESRMPVNADELLELRSTNDVRTRQLLDMQAALLDCRRRGAVSGELSQRDLVEALPRALGRELVEGYALERMLAAVSESGGKPMRASHAVASLMFLSVDSVDERLRGVFAAYRHELDGGGRVPLAQVRELVGTLLLTGQVPLEKRAKERPRPFYLPNEWEELTADEAMQHVQPEDEQSGGLDEAALKRFLCSDCVCIWGECYRLAEEAERKKAAEQAERDRLNPPWWAFWRSKPPAAPPTAA
ncbi:hypothetical protein KFE25_009101 [Diacronema lutheri]|uniref:Uncharacterized protein n=1 Tax=Diacronema lutheri TaxID=2081491 RepID=A0A8J5Y386_DIALT|nr:hypothetical protein KFE25_009101 [Diacronema lutheri]